MRFLADAGISPKTVDFLRRAGHDAVHVRELAMQRASDRAVAERARSDERAEAVNRRLEAVLAEQAAALASGALVLVEGSRYRIRTLPIRSG